MQNFFDQVKVSLAGSITFFSSTPPNCVYIELNYRDNKIEIDYDSRSVSGRYAGSSIGATFVLSIDLGSELELEILPKSFFDRLFDVQAGVSLFDSSKKIRIKIPSLGDEIIVHTNNADLANNLLNMPDVGKLVSDYGITFFKIDNGELKVYLNELSAEKFEELRLNPILLAKYLDIVVDLAGHIKGG